MGGSKRADAGRQEPTKPEFVSDEAWEAMSPVQRVRCPSTVAGVLAAWLDYEHVRSMVNQVLESPRVPSGKGVSRLSLIESNGHEDSYLAIADASQRGDDFSLFHRGPSPFRSLVLCCWKVLQEDPEWKKRERRRRGSESPADVPDSLSRM